MDITPNTSTTITGLFFGEDGKIRAFAISKAAFMEVVCHAMSGHGVNYEGGFFGGNGTVTGKGVAVGFKARTINENGDPIDAIQLGEGTNTTPGTLQVYDTLVLLANGMINPEILPNQDGGTGGIVRDTVITDEPVTVVEANNMNYLADAVNSNVTFVLPDPAKVQNMPFTFRLANQNSGYAMTVERSGDATIYVNGEQWLGVTTDELGFWFTLVAKGTDYYITTDKGLTVANNNIS